MKAISIICAVAFITSAYSQEASKFDGNLLGGTDPVLNDQEKAGVATTEAWKNKSFETLLSKPGVSPSTEFKFGASYPTIVCAVLQVTDIELQKGEAITRINLGDTTRWMVESAVSGSGADQIEHLIVKPRDRGISTSMIVTTDRRTYHLLLASDASDFMHDVTFYYDTPVAAPAPKHKDDKDDPKKDTKDRDDSKDPPRRRKTVVKKDSIPVKDDADVNYTVNGDAPFRPVNVYSKDGKTYLEMPPSVQHDEVPVLFEERKSGLFGHSKNLCNYRVHGNWYVVDKVLGSATLVVGVGPSQKKVVIQHAKE